MGAWESSRYAANFNHNNFTFIHTFLMIPYIWVLMGFYGSLFRTFSLDGIRSSLMFPTEVIISSSMALSYFLSFSFLFSGDGCGIVIWSIFIRLSTLDTNPPSAIIVSCPSILFLTKSMSTSLCEYLPSYGITFEKQYVLYPRTVIHFASLCSEWFRRNATGDGLMPSMRSLFM